MEGIADMIVLTREVEDVTAYRKVPSGDLVPVGRGVTHYSVGWVTGMVGDAIQEALIDAGLPDATTVRYWPAGQLLVVTIPGDDAGAYAATAQTVIDEQTTGS